MNVRRSSRLAATPLGRGGSGDGGRDSRKTSVRQGRDDVELSVTKWLSIGNAVISADAEHPTIVQYERGRLGKKVKKMQKMQKNSEG
ncbi:hypothetical protein BSKO_05426 [Bryopsis sp. KO-2023]|nr:hypothetical protein BSKO_05426 [Bryopsis sp. KO-2023]